jgi:hypothetical protein
MEAIEEAASVAQEVIDKNAAGDPDVKKMMKIVKQFIQEHKVLCYGGTAINNLLSKKNQFYDPERDIPDYDFFSETPQEHARRLSDLLAKAGIQNVEAKPGMHLGTFKVFANYTGVADISFLSRPIFSKLWRESIAKDDIHYVPPNFLRMSVYLELSRPMGNVERWKKVYSRLQRLDSEYPVGCHASHTGVNEEILTHDVRKKIEDILLKDKVVLLGFNASMLQQDKNEEWKLPLDLLVDPEKAHQLTKDLLHVFGKGKLRVREFEEYGELLPAHTDIIEGGKLLVRVYETMACHSYHALPSGLHVASIPTLLNFFFAMLYADDEFIEHTSRQRLVCTANKLIQMSKHSSKRRFELLTPITCIGKQKDMIDMKRERAEMYEKLSKNKKSAEFLKFFFSYKPMK